MATINKYATINNQLVMYTRDDLVSPNSEAQFILSSLPFVQNKASKAYDEGFRNGQRHQHNFVNQNQLRYKQLDNGQFFKVNELNGDIFYSIAVSMPKPDLNKFIFLKSLDNLRGILIDDMNLDGRNEIVDIDKDDLYVMLICQR